MKKSYFIISLLLIASFILPACTSENHNQDKPNTNDAIENDNGEDNVTSDDTTDQEDGTTEENDSESDNDDEENEPQPLALFELSDLLIEAMSQDDWETVSEFVHPNEGLLFSPYIYIDEDAVIIDQEDVANLPNSDEIFTWGVYDGKGSPIELTPEDYFEEFLEMTPFLEPDEVLIDTPQDRGNTINNVTEVFPNAHIVEYYHAGSEEYSGIDWSSVLLVFLEDEDGTNQLVAIIRDMWTV